MRLPDDSKATADSAPEGTLPYLALILLLSAWLGLQVGERIWG